MKFVENNIYVCYSLGNKGSDYMGFVSRNRTLFLLLLFVMIIGMVVGGTYAWVVIKANVVNSTYNATSTCFLLDYTDNTQTIVGTMFPSADHTGGLTGGVSMKVSSSCSVTGTGVLYLHINNNTSTKFGTTASEHCENATTLTTLKNYKTSSQCSSGNGSWVTNGKVFKYAIYDNAAGTGTPLKVGYFDSSKIGSDQTLYSNFVVNSTQKNMYVFFWLDGYLTDNTYTNLLFSGYIYVIATQTS